MWIYRIPDLTTVQSTSREHVYNVNQQVAVDPRT